MYDTIVFKTRESQMNLKTFLVYGKWEKLSNFKISEYARILGNENKKTVALLPDGLGYQ